MTNMNSPYDIKQLSIIIPVGARRSNLKDLYHEYKSGVAAVGVPYEFIFVIDGPRPDAARALQELLRDGEDLTVVHLTRNFGEAAALMAGFERSSGNAILTLPAYEQVEPAELRKLIAALGSSDVAIGYRWPRAGNAFDKARRAAFHWLVKVVTGTSFRDLGCGVRALRRQVFEELDLYGDHHRFLAILATRLGFRVCEVPLRQSVKDRFERIYRPREYAHHALDLFSIFFLVRFTKRPLRFFGMLGASTFAIGAALITYLGVERFFFDERLADRPALILAALLIVLGMQIFALGLLGELIIFTHARGLKDYRVEQVIHYPESADTAESIAVEPASSESKPEDVSRAAPAALA